MGVRFIIVTILTKSVWWPYTQSVINMDFINKCIVVTSRVCEVYLFKVSPSLILLFYKITK